MRHTKSVPILLTTFLALCACASGSLGTHVREDVHKTVPAAGLQTLQVNNTVGEVTVTGWSKPTIQIDATKNGNAIEDVHNITVDVTSNAGTTTISTNYHGVSHTGGVSYTIHAPASTSLVIDENVGNIAINGIQGNVTGKVQIGNVDALLGTIAANRAVTLTATTGRVHLAMAANSSASINAKSSMGDVTSQFPAVIERQNVVGATGTAKVGAGTAHVTLSTSTGAIEITKSTR